MQRESLSLQPCAAAQDPSLPAGRMLGSTAEHELSGKVEGQDEDAGQRRGRCGEKGVEAVHVQAATQPSCSSFPRRPPLTVCEALLRDSGGCNYMRISASPGKGF